jgi:hypothetical protein
VAVCPRPRPHSSPSTSRPTCRLCKSIFFFDFCIATYCCGAAIPTHTYIQSPRVHTYINPSVNPPSSFLSFISTSHYSISTIPITLPMSSSRDDRYYNPGKSRRGTPAPDSQSSLFFQGQGGRTVLPPLSSAISNSHSSGLFFSVPLQLTQ